MEHAPFVKMVSHNTQGSVSVTRFSVTLYCEVHDENSPIDGIYNGGNVGQQPAQALHTTYFHVRHSW